MNLARTLAILPAAALLFLGGSCTTIEFNPCFGMERYESIGVELVEAASPTGTYSLANPATYLIPTSAPTCAGFDGLDAGDSVVFSDVELANKIRPSQNCSTPVGDVVLDGELVAETLREESVVGYPYTLLQGGASEGGVGAAAPNTTIAGCTGTWTLATYPLGIVFEHSDVFIDSPEWLDDYTFDPLSPGTKPPVVIVRTFVVDEGTPCPALGVEAGPFTCGDVFSGYYEPVP